MYEQDGWFTERYNFFWSSDEMYTTMTRYISWKTLVHQNLQKSLYCAN